jgi:hypothetical protein
MPRIDNVVVFGDSLSDIGRKWKTGMGSFAKFFNLMQVSPTGRFSDCRNWTDFMLEAAGKRLVMTNSDNTITRSMAHQRLSLSSWVRQPNQVQPGFYYVNYAMGGACGDAASCTTGLTPFSEQVDEFEADFRTAITHGWEPGNTLFIIWFGANDLYSAERNPSEMKCVVDAMMVQRQRLADLVSERETDSRRPVASFVFIDLARPLSSARYSKWLDEAQQGFNKTIDVPEFQAWPYQREYSARDVKRHASNKSKQFLKLKAEVERIKNLERGVVTFNAALVAAVRLPNTGLVELCNCLDEEQIYRLSKKPFGLVRGANDKPIGKRFVDPAHYPQGAMMHTNDGAHPTDRMYWLIWCEIRKVISQMNLQFGMFTQGGPAHLSNISQEVHEANLHDHRARFNDVLDNIGRNATRS